MRQRSAKVVNIPVCDVNIFAPVTTRTTRGQRVLYVCLFEQLRNVLYIRIKQVQNLTVRNFHK